MQFLTLNTANLLTYLRRVYGLNQGEIGQIMGISTTTVSRLEAGKNCMNFIQENKLRQHFGYRGDPIREGHIELENQGRDAQVFQTPKDWKYQLSSGKLGKIFRLLFLCYFSPSDFKAFCQHQGVDELYFFNSANPVSINFHLRIIQHLRMHGKLKTQREIDDFMSYLMGKVGTLQNEVIRIPDLFSRIETAIQRLPNYEKNHSYALDYLNRKKKKMAVKFRPNRDVMDYHLWKSDPYSGGFAENWVATFFKHILQHPFRSSAKFYRPSKNEEWYVLEVQL